MINQYILAHYFQNILMLIFLKLSLLCTFQMIRKFVADQMNLDVDDIWRELADIFENLNFPCFSLSFLKYHWLFFFHFSYRYLTKLNFSNNIYPSLQKQLDFHNLFIFVWNLSDFDGSENTSICSMVHHQF